MKLKIKYKDLIRNLFGYLFVITLTLQCRSMWMSSTHRNLLTNALLMLLLISAVGYCANRRIRKKNIRNFICVSFVLGFYMIFFLLINSLNSTSFIRFIVAVWAIYFLVLSVEYENILQLLLYYKNTILVICTISLFFWLFGSVLGILHSNGTIISNWTGKAGVVKTVVSYYGIYFEPQSINFLQILRVTRNCACFTEAPMCSFQFCLAFLIHLFLESKRDIKQTIILSLGILSTFATSGYILFAFAIVAKYMLSKPKFSLLKLLKYSVVPIMIIGVIWVAAYLLRDKLSVGTSGSTRLNDFYAGFLAWKNHLIFGNGFGNEESYTKYMLKSVRATDNYGFSNSPMQILAYGGIYFGIPYVGSIIYSLWNLATNKKVNELILFVSFCYLFCFTLVPFQYLTIFLMMVFTKKVYVNNDTV